ncbi:uncharacterized protein LOC126844270 isoform X2 [Adelges cooleyi]|uniref:uncharacterized protein LOC126844270 isoform X2 n=1 Tax=Adelges cooleyi TaxID=133065 RepID=UPI002180384E|nr:uncharacterized protein LOC126844270 isoform X2 [Adelges cooleyi]
MDFYNKNFYLMVRHVDPDGMLNVPLNVFTHKKCLGKYFKTCNDFKKLDMVVACEKSIILLNNFEDIVNGPLNMPYFQNTFQRRKYAFILISESFIGLLILYKNSVTAYYDTCNKSLKHFFPFKMPLDIIDKESRPNSRKKPANQPLQKKRLKKNEEQLTETQNLILTGRSTDVQGVNLPFVLMACEQNIDGIGGILMKDVCHNKTIDQLQITNLNQSKLLNQPTEQFSNLNPNIMLDIQLFSNTVEQQNGIESSKPTDQHLNKPSGEFPNLNPNILADNPLLSNVGEKMVTENIQTIVGGQDQPLQQTNNFTKNNTNQQKEMLTENECILSVIQQPLKRKRRSKVIEHNKKKTKIEYSSACLNNRIKKFEGDAKTDRPFQIMTNKFVHQFMNHLPLRHFAFYNKLHIGFAALTLQTELEIINIQDDVFNNDITMNNYKAIVEKCNYSKTPSYNCIFEQCMNNSLPHLSLISLAEECLTNNSVVWRDTVNEMNKKLEIGLKDVSAITRISKGDWDEFEARIKRKVNNSLLPNKTLVVPEVSHVELSQPFVAFPLPQDIDELLNVTPNLTRLPQHKSTELPEVVFEDLQQMPIELGNLNNAYDDQTPRHDFSPNKIHGKDVLSKIAELLSSPNATGNSVQFTQLCPVQVTCRKKALQMISKLLSLHKEKGIILTQPSGSMDPSSITIELNY